MVFNLNLKIFSSTVQIIHLLELNILGGTVVIQLLVQFLHVIQEIVLTVRQESK